VVLGEIELRLRMSGVIWSIKLWMSYFLVETAKANELIPFDYLKYLFEELPKEPKDINYLLPWNGWLAKK